mmetsp:Transcript_2469/g.5242  ORF Transcript_2469/g.5242 Transcript_2469/m.5242 type:complete len:86 (+) Transcript_2469:281-538(+)
MVFPFRFSEYTQIDDSINMRVEDGGTTLNLIPFKSISNKTTQIIVIMFMHIMKHFNPFPSQVSSTMNTMSLRFFVAVNHRIREFD